MVKVVNETMHTIGKYHVSIFIIKRPSKLSNKKAETIMSDLLFKSTGKYFNAQVSEEEDFDLPAFSLYYSGDARSFCGRWYFTNCEEDICWGLISDMDTCKIINNLISNAESRCKNDEIVFAAVWEK